jgi:energy-coupling factor transport system permease protein
MISDITLGQYFPGDSALHRLDPRTKIILTVLFIVSVFLANSPVGFFLVLAATVALIAISRISFKVILKGIKPIVFVLIFTALINVFVTKGEGEPLVDFWIIKIFKEGLIRAFFMSFRVILLITGTSVLLTYTTSPILLTDGLENLLSPLKLVKVPVHILAMMMMIALRFIPTLIEETEKIMNAQKSRGADFTSGSLVRRAKALIPILIPLIISAFKRADELAVAMECRCYRGDKNRTKMRKLKYRAIDLSWFFIGAIFIGAMIALLTLPDSVWSFLPDNVFAIVFYNLK